METGIFNILTNLMTKYTGDKSSSMKEDTAISILNSIYYSINAYIESRSKLNEKTYLMAEENVGEMYENGLNIVKKCVIETKLIYEQVRTQKLNVSLEIYNDTIDRLDDFFKNYDVIFAAHDGACDIDYPLAFDDMNITGVFYIKQYLEKLKIETEFCKFFDEKFIIKFLKDYGRKYKINIVKYRINLFEMLVDQSIFVSLIGKNKKGLVISKLDVQIIKKSFYGKTDSEISLLIDNAFEKIINKFNINNFKLINYMRKYKESFKVRLITAYRNYNIINMIVVDEEKIEVQKIDFNKQTKMKDYDFSNLVNEIMKYQSSKNKVDSILSNVHSFDDFIDILDSECLFGYEYIEVFKSLDSMSIAALGKVVFSDDLRCESLDLSYENLIKYRENLEAEWQNYYIDFLLDLEEEGRQDIESIIVTLNVEANDENKMYF